MKTVLATILILCLCGCKVGSHQNTQSVQQGQPPRSEQAPLRPLPVPVVAAQPARDEPRAEVVDVPDSIASNNATQQSLSGLGVQLGKVAEKVDASLVRMETAVSAAVTLQNEVRAEVRTELRAQADVQASAIAQLRADVSAVAHAQVGLSNQMMQTTQTAGRDISTQFSDGMERLMVKMIGVIDSIVLAFVGTYFGSVLTVISTVFAYLRLQSRLRERDAARDDRILEKAVLKGIVK